MGFQPHLRHVISWAIVAGGPSYSSLTETHDIVRNLVAGGFDPPAKNLIERENNALQ